MVQSLLEDRFKLIVREEPRQISLFALVPARADGLLGPNMQKTDDYGNRETRPALPPQPAGATLSSGCGTMSSVALLATRWIRGPVIDRTGITGTFRFFMHISSEDSPVFDALPGLPALARSGERPVGDPNLPSFRDALRDQLGLRVESVRGPLDVLVIESVQQPTEN